MHVWRELRIVPDTNPCARRTCGRAENAVDAVGRRVRACRRPTSAAARLGRRHPRQPEPALCLEPAEGHRSVHAAISA